MSKSELVNMYLTDIAVYVDGALDYFRDEFNPNFDKNEMIAYLASVPEIVEDIMNLLKEIELKRQEEIFELEKRYY